MIEVQHLTKRYNDVEALKDISFKVSKGEVLGFLGPNGAGKTTTMKIITGYTAPTSGDVKINTLSVGEHQLVVKRLIGYLPESVPLYDDMSVLEYLRFVADIRFKQLIQQKGGAAERTPSKREALKRVIEICGLQTMIRRPIGELSKGYRQRTCLAQAMVHNPDILILDEPTSGLDPNQIAEIREVIKAIGREKTVILSTHILQEVQAMCNRVIIINEGRIVAQGTAEELERKAEGKHSVYVKMRGIRERIHELLQDLPSVDQVLHKDSEGHELFGFEVIVGGGSDIREMIFKAAVRAETPIFEMRLERMGLEDVFRQLTTVR